MSSKTTTCRLAVQPTIVQLRFTWNCPCHADRLLSTRPYTCTCQYQQSRRTGPTSVSLVPDNCAPLNHWSYHVGHWLHRHIIHWFMASNCSKIKCPCCIMDTPLAPSPLKPAPPLIQTLLVVHCQQTCGKEIGLVSTALTSVQKNLDLQTLMC